MTRSRAVLLALFLVPAVLKIVVSAGANSFGTDGSYYAEIASHVQNGEGLTTRLSLFHHGYETFPHPTPVYPLWPLMLGLTARVVGLDVAAIWLPTLLYFTAVLFAWLWARGLPRVPLFARYPDGPDTAHAAALLVAFNGPIFDKTSLPYTEGLALTLLFACLWRCQSLWRTRGWLAGVEMGVWVGVLFLARSQLVLVAMAAACAFSLGLAVAPGRRRTITMALACAAVAVAIVLPHYLHLTGITVRPGTGLLRFELAQANSLLTPVDVLTDQEGLIAVAIDRLGGVPVAFSPTHPLAYMRIFYGMQYALLLAIPLIVALLWRSMREDARGAWLRWRSDPSALSWAFLLFLAAGGIASIHLVHKDFGAEWHFARRHALTAFFAFYLSWLFLVHCGKSNARQFALVLFVAALAGGGSQMVRLSARSVLQTKGHEAHIELVAFLDERGAASAPMNIAVGGHKTQGIALLTGNRVNYHSLVPHTRTEDLRVMFSALDVKLLLLQNGYKTGEWRFLHEDEFHRLFHKTGEIETYAVYELRPAALGSR